MRGRKWRRLRRWLGFGLLLGVLAALLVFLGGNWFLTSSPGRRLLARQLERRTPALRWEVAGATWSPWQGVTVRRLSAHLRSPGGGPGADLPPLLRLREMRLQPHWREVWKGRKVFHEIGVDQPELNLPLEYLVVVQPSTTASADSGDLASSSASERDAREDGEARENEPSVVREAGGEQSAAPVAGKSGPDSGRSRSGEQTARGSGEAAARPLQREDRFWLRFREARVRLYSVNSAFELTVDGLSGDLPLAGPDIGGRLAWQGLALGEHALLDAGSWTVEWREKQWIFPNREFELALGEAVGEAGLSFRLGGAFAPRLPGKPFRVNSALDPQSLAPVVYSQWGGLRMEAAEVAAHFSAQGRLLHPQTWQAALGASAEALAVTSSQRQQTFVFDSVRLRGRLQQAVLHFPELAFRSETFSLLGNGSLALGGSTLGVLRLVAAPDLAERFTKVAVGSLVSVGWTSSWLQPLVTPDRLYRDLHFEGVHPRVVVNTGRKGEFLLVSQVVDLLGSFLTREAAEEESAPRTLPAP
ncbi:hypothetical protein [Roseibacillus ishigakijimensis]|uniref:Uncharacterized protein n=1 Tax=Roseibacillus ishigakijimensis TaxID=454146 RepID=A0A934RMG6_9BACT|nr:hypothetical protein [Roseibacillus ishigakijimensis]MBK1834502.1 hypothetical protein [Roseibacillus ishigakijimensis]